MVRMQYGCPQGHEGIEAKTGGNLQLAIAPSNGEQLAETRQDEDEKDAENGKCRLQLHENVPLMRGAGQRKLARDRPRDGPDSEEQDGNDQDGLARKGVADRAQD